jgi:hypothetical protein
VTSALGLVAAAHAQMGDRANPDLHLSFIASLFLQRPGLPQSSNTGYTTKTWIDKTEQTIVDLAALWERVRDKDGAHAHDIGALLTG